MEPVYHEAEHFNPETMTRSGLQTGEYEGCLFSGLDLNGADLSASRFSSCTFTGCNLSMAILHKTAIREVTFRDCKMTGLHFEQCNQYGFEAHFEHCILQLASFTEMKIPETTFSHCDLSEVDLTGSQFPGSTFDHCNLSGAIFENSNLEKADLRTSWGFQIDPEKNRIRKAKFSQAGLPGLLARYDIEIE
ncbi:MAG: pentapeptide repeat-containing protein [Chitinophagaceae bacterium]|nr:pentapeptide repeat-containing protein [Chitinophagaceae bacterium]